MAYGQSIDELFLGLRLQQDITIKIRRNTTVVEEMISAAGGASNQFDYSITFTETEVSVSSAPLFYGLSGIQRIVRVDNPYLYAAYLLKKQQKGWSASETTVFHGTRIENVESICKNNLNYRLREYVCGIMNDMCFKARLGLQCGRYVCKYNITNRFNPQQYNIATDGTEPTGID